MKKPAAKTQCQGERLNHEPSAWGARSRCTRTAGPSGFCAQHAPKVADASKGVLYVVGIDKSLRDNQRLFVEAAIPVVFRGPKTTTIERTSILGHRERLDFGDSPVVNVAHDWDPMGARFASYDRELAMTALREHIRTWAEETRKLSAEWERMLTLLPKEPS